MINEKTYASYVTHIEEFRRRLICCLLTVIFFVPLCWLATTHLINWLWTSFAVEELGTMVYSAPMEMFFLRLKLAFILSICAAMPVLMWNIGRYIYPALHAHERKIALSLSCGGAFLFAGGAAIALFLTYPLIMRFAYSMHTEMVQPLLNVSSCVSLACWLMLGFGICFQLPILVLALVKLGVLSVPTLKLIRPYVVIGIFIVAAVFTPPDIVSQIMMGLPAWLLFELSIVVARFISPRRSKASGGEVSDVVTPDDNNK